MCCPPAPSPMQCRDRARPIWGLLCVRTASCMGTWGPLGSAVPHTPSSSSMRMAVRSPQAVGNLGQCPMACDAHGAEAVLGCPELVWEMSSHADTRTPAVSQERLSALPPPCPKCHHCPQWGSELILPPPLIKAPPALCEAAARAGTAVLPLKQSC